MHFPNLLAGAALLLASSAQAINILMSNDDSFGSGNLRETYRLLKDAGHNVYIVAPAFWQSGQGGRSDFTTEANLTTPSIYDLIPAGAPSIGTDPHDSHIWYYNGTPAACIFVALDYVLPRFGDFKVPDLVLTGPNFGTNLGPFVWTLAGTAGAAYSSTHRSIPAIAFSATNNETPYFEIKNETNPATYAAKLATKIVQHFVDSTPKGAPILPLGYGMNINFPVLNGVVEPPIVHTRMTGNAEVNEAVWHADKGVFTWGNLRPYAAGINACINGDCSLPGETYAQANGAVTISIYTVDYDAPNSEYTKSITERIKPLTKRR
ncbi:Acid phosphatase [Cladobotryum mycophilum]|uniref:Acid phosphatase n=1 Tax=Cladobotryum mycophilum TaxID=491253 RepID=A0ABR0SRY1_9HYPO